MKKIELYIKCDSCGKRMKLMKVSEDGINWRNAFVCTGPKIGCGIKEIKDVNECHGTFRIENKTYSRGA